MTQVQTTCYRHPNRETGVACSMCGRSICPECMTPTQVGMRCPECAGQRTKIKKVATQANTPIVTMALIAINVVVFLATIAAGASLTSGGGGEIFQQGELSRIAIEFHQQYWRLITYGFLHSGILHIAFNMYFLYFIGQMLEPSLGKVKFLALYFTAMLAGACGALLVSPNVATVGASGAVFGLLGAAFVMQKMRGIDPMQSGLGPIIIINIALSFVLANISIGGHIGGLIGGAAAGWLMEHYAYHRSKAAPLLSCLVVAFVAGAGAILVAAN